MKMSKNEAKRLKNLKKNSSTFIRLQVILQLAEPYDEKGPLTIVKHLQKIYKRYIPSQIISISISQMEEAIN